MEDHKTYLSHSERGWILIHQGSPLCDYNATKKEALAVAAHYKITLPAVTWNGDRGQWVNTDTIEEPTT
jgi:hypothetical protein